jgi:hypothetical protein
MDRADRIPREEVNMRGISLLLIGVGLVACTTTAAQQRPLRSAAKQLEFDRMLAGKAAGPPQSCLPHYRSNDMVVIDESTIAFRDGSRRVYVNHMMGGCSNLCARHQAVRERRLVPGRYRPGGGSHQPFHGRELRVRRFHSVHEAGRLALLPSRDG